MTKPTSVPTGLKFAAPAEAVEYVMGYALRNYECTTEAWHEVVECHARADIAELVKGCKTAAGAVSLVRCSLGLAIRAEYANSICSEAW